jgi:hypothetical protein
MPFRHSCFISYRAGNRQRDNPYLFAVTEGLRTHLSAELELLLEEDVNEVYVDSSRLQGGDFFNRTLERALCESVCMIALFTPTYFSVSHSYCAREFKAMLDLEAMRFSRLKVQRSPERGLIIPIVLRREDRLPRFIREERHFYNFEAFLQNDLAVDKPREYFNDIRRIAEYIAERYWELSALPNDPCPGCDDFRFSTHTEIRAVGQRAGAPASHAW